MSEVVLGVIGGSGLYDMEGFTAQEEIVLDTPFGSPSDAYIVGELEGANAYSCLAMDVDIFSHRAK